MSTIEQFNKYVMPSYGRYDLVLDKGEGRQAVDENGKEYIDFGSGIGTNSLGYCNDNWVKAVCDQAHRIQHTSNYYYTKVQADFAKALCETAGYTDMFFGNSGAEANECAIKIARKYSFDKYGKGRHNIITLVNSFHGRTLCTLSATGQDVFHNYFFPFVEGFINVEANNIEDLRAKLDDTVCAVMFEYVQGEGGVMALQQDFVDEYSDSALRRTSSPSRTKYRPASAGPVSSLLGTISARRLTSRLSQRDLQAAFRSACAFPERSARKFSRPARTAPHSAATPFPAPEDWQC